MKTTEIIELFLLAKHEKETIEREGVQFPLRNRNYYLKKLIKQFRKTLKNNGGNTQ